MGYGRLNRSRSGGNAWLRWLPLFVAALLAGGALAAFFAVPRVVEVGPAPDAQEASPHARVVVAFDRPMNQASVEAALRTEPAQPGSFQWNAEGTRVVWRPAVAWPLQSPVRVTLAGGQSTLGLPVLEARTWTFTVGQERLAYLVGAVPNLAVISLADGAAPQMLTAEPFGVNDFAVAPDGASVVYSAGRADGGADLRLVEVEGGAVRDLLACPEALCRAPAISPDGARVAYERQTPGLDAAGDRSFGEPRVYVLELAGGLDAPVDDLANQTRAPQWAPDGRLAYYDAARQAIVVRALTGAATFIPTDSGQLGTWAPDGQRLIYAEIFLSEAATALTDTVPVEAFYSHLLEVTVATNAVRNLSGAGVVEDASPVYAFGGDRVAFARKALAPESWTPGRQVWVMTAAGADARPLTQAPEYAHSALAWSPDDRYLAFMRLNATNLAEPSEIWIMQADGSGARRLALGGYLPKWLP